MSINVIKLRTTVSTDVRRFSGYHRHPVGTECAADSILHLLSRAILPKVRVDEVEA